MYADSGEDFAKPAKFLSVTNRRRILVGICVMLSIGILGVAVGSIVAVTFYECDKVPFTEIHLYSIDASQVEELLVSMPPIRDSYLELEEDPTLSAIIVNATRISSRKTYLDDFSETVPTNGDIGFHFSGIASYILGCPKYNVSIRTPSRIYSKVRLKSINSHYIVNGIQSRQLYMQSTAGGITVRNFAVEELFATTAKGKVEVSEGSSLRFANLSSQLTGDVRLQNFVSPEIRAKALNGRIVVTNVSCSDSANLITSRGQIDVFSVFMKDHQSMLSTSNEISGKVRVDIFPEGSMESITMGGDIDVLLPGSFQGSFALESSRGSVSLDGFGSTVQYMVDNDYIKRGTIGRGSREITLTSQTGDITLTAEK